MEGLPLGEGEPAKIVPLSGIVGRTDGTPYADKDAVVDYDAVLNSSMVMREMRIRRRSTWCLG
jgi:hypothetical protein